MPFFTIPEQFKDDLPTPLTFVDVLYDHAGYLTKNKGKLGQESLRDKKVAIVGSGPAGLAAAYLLSKMNASVTIFEQDENRVGGRIYSYSPISGDKAVFELGAMRVPPSEQVFRYFANEFKVQPGGQFPDPGKVFTQIVFQNKTYDWQPTDPQPPQIFKTVSQAWQSLAGSFGPITKNLADSTTFGNAQKAWQQLIYNGNGPGPEQGYSTISFYQGLVQAFVENYKTYGLTQPWGAQEFALFGALGLGSGGFGPLYQVNFAEIVRLVINGLETKQQFYPNGMSKLIQGFQDKVGGSIKRGMKVVSVQRNTTKQNGKSILVTTASGTGTDTFDAAIIATTTRSMQVDMGLTDPVIGSPVLSEAQNTAIRELHMMNSSKLFVLTRTKFWLNSKQPLPANIQTDGLVRGLYCLDYPGTDHGVVLISYTWGDDSTKYIAIKDPEQRLSILLKSLGAAVPAFVKALGPEIMSQYTTMIDWQEQPSYYGAFKLNFPGQDPMNQALYYQFLSRQKDDIGIYLAGDSVGWCGGWIEGALQTGVNAAAAVFQKLGGTLFADNPMLQKSSLYSYGP